MKLETEKSETLVGAATSELLRLEEGYDGFRRLCSDNSFIGQSRLESELQSAFDRIDSFVYELLGRSGRPAFTLAGETANCTPIEHAEFLLARSRSIKATYCDILHDSLQKYAGAEEAANLIRRWDAAGRQCRLDALCFSRSPYTLMAAATELASEGSRREAASLYAEVERRFGDTDVAPDAANERLKLGLDPADLGAPGGGELLRSLRRRLQNYASAPEAAFTSMQRARLSGDRTYMNWVLETLESSAGGCAALLGYALPDAIQTSVEASGASWSIHRAAKWVSAAVAEGYSVRTMPVCESLLGLLAEADRDAIAVCASVTRSLGDPEPTAFMVSKWFEENAVALAPETRVGVASSFAEWLRFDAVTADQLAKVAVGVVSSAVDARQLGDAIHVLSSCADDPTRVLACRKLKERLLSLPIATRVTVLSSVQGWWGERFGMAIAQGLSARLLDDLDAEEGQMVAYVRLLGSLEPGLSGVPESIRGRTIDWLRALSVPTSAALLEALSEDERRVCARALLGTTLASCQDAVALTHRELEKIGCWLPLAEQGVQDLLRWLRGREAAAAGDWPEPVLNDVLSLFKHLEASDRAAAAALVERVALAAARSNEKDAINLISSAVDVSESPVLSAELKSLRGARLKRHLALAAVLLLIALIALIVAAVAAST